MSLSNKHVASVIHPRGIAKVTKSFAAPSTLTNLVVDLQCALDQMLEW